MNRRMEDAILEADLILLRKVRKEYMKQERITANDKKGKRIEETKNEQ